MCQQDYRQEEIARLKAAGKTDEEIVKAARDDYLSLKLDVLKLKGDVQMLHDKVVVLEQIGLMDDAKERGNINGTKTTAGKRPASLKGSATKDEIQ